MKFKTYQIRKTDAELRTPRRMTCEKCERTYTSDYAHFMVYEHWPRLRDQFVPTEYELQDARELLVQMDAARAAVRGGYNRG